jgi:hypothetical protein
VRATMSSDGAIQHIEAPEVHSDPLSGTGILAFYHFGWSLLDDLRAAGFRDVRLGVLHDPMSGLTGNNYGFDEYGTMLPLFFRCQR